MRHHGLGQLRERGRAQAIHRIEGGYRVETDRGALDSRRVVLALGLGEQLCLPAWSHGLVGDGCVEHIFSPGFRREAYAGVRTVAVVGGGITAAQVASALAAGGTEVTLVARHAPRVHLFDSDPGWLGPKAMSKFSRTRDALERRKLISSARHRGSMPPEVESELRRLQCGYGQWLQAQVVAVERRASGVRLQLDRPPQLLEVERVVLATGFEGHRPGGSLLGDEAIDRLGLACAECGYPLVSRRLEWSRGLFVSGPLAELELGPSARNIAGARAAGQRLLAAV